MTFNRFYRFDFAVTQIFSDVELSSKYYGITISAHLLSYTPTSVIQLLNQTHKPFFIDPMTFVFARDIRNICRNGEIRRSYQKLMDDYGSPFSNCRQGGQLLPSYFIGNNGLIDDSRVIDVCKRVLSFQQINFKMGNAFAKYEKLLKKSAVTRTSTSPAFLVAPYFYAVNCNSPWYKISLKCAEESRKLKGNEQLYPVICISQEILWDEAQISRIVSEYEGFDGYLIWVDDLDEEHVSPILGLKNFVSKLAEYGKPVYSLYGGFLCDLLMKFGLGGYSSGICYGEKRSVDTIGGGAGNRYYVPTVHVKISEDLANAFFSESSRNINLMCRCPTCQRIRNNLPSSADPRTYTDAYFNRMTFLDFRRHFVNVKFQEMNLLARLNLHQIATLLDQDIQTISNIDVIPDHPSELIAQHLRIWRTLFV